MEKIDLMFTTMGMTAAEASEGLTAQSPVVIGATSSMTGVPAEYAWLKEKFGTMEKDWSVDLRSLGRNELGRTIETFRIRLANGSKLEIHFDITAFHQL